jgi:hypothetical protein
MTPDWGQPGPNDDPRLDIDDVNGWGPENINFSNPESRTYSVGVHYFSDNGFGQSFVTVRVYIRGELVQELRRKRMVDQQFWHVLDIAWPSAELITQDRMYGTIPSR